VKLESGPKEGPDDEAIEVYGRADHCGACNPRDVGDWLQGPPPPPRAAVNLSATRAPLAKRFLLAAQSYDSA
jgi:hypothetical protein